MKNVLIASLLVAAASVAFAQTGAPAVTTASSAPAPKHKMMKAKKAKKAKAAASAASM